MNQKAQEWYMTNQKYKKVGKIMKIYIHAMIQIK